MEMRADYEEQRRTVRGARGSADSIIYPEDTRSMLSLAFRAAFAESGAAPWRVPTAADPRFQ